MELIRYFDTAFTVYYWILIARILMSWFKLPNNPIFLYLWDFLYELTEPVLSLFRRIMPPAMVGAVGIDFSPIIAMIVLRFGYSALIRPILAMIISSAGL